MRLTWEEIIASGNDAARESRRGGTPLLTKDASLATLIEWLAWADPNGEWRRTAPEFVRADAWECVRVIIQDNR